jgi:hypothetical protein
MQFSSTGTTATYYIRFSYKCNTSLSKDVNSATILSSVAKPSPFIITNKQLSAIPRLLAFKY